MAMFYSRDPEWADVKLAQAKYLLSRLNQFKTQVAERYDCIPSVIVTGDFNSTPGDQVEFIGFSVFAYINIIIYQFQFLCYDFSIIALEYNL